MMKPTRFKAFVKKKHIAELCFTGVLALLIINVIQSLRMFPAVFLSKRLVLYFGGQIILIAIFIYLCYPGFKRDGLIYKLLAQYRNMPIPKGAKIAVTIVLIGNLSAIVIGKSRYPFYDVGMFRWTTPFKNQSKIVSKPKYYYIKDGHVNMLDLRKESFFFLSDYWSWGATHEYTFGLTYHNKEQKSNFDFILSKMKQFGVDTLWVGVQSVDYKTGKVTFDPDVCHAIKVNDSAKLHYGKIYIPEYQINKCR
jgi:hypothetical protein